MDEREREVRIIELEKQVNKLIIDIDAIQAGHSLFRKVMNTIKKHQKYIRVIIDVLAVCGAILSFII